MAYLPLDEEQQKTSNTPSIGAANTPTTGGGAGGVAPQAGTPTAPTSQPFAGLSSYLSANQPQAANLGSTIATNLGQQYNTEKGAIDTAAQKAGQDVTSGTVPYNASLVNQAVSNPTSFVSNPNNLADWQKLYGAQYTGPGSFESSNAYGDAASAAAKAAQTAQLGKTGGGYTQLLQGVEQNPTQGKTALDASLLQGVPAAKTQIASALNPFSGISDYLSGKSSDIAGQIAQGKQTSANTATQTAAALNAPEQQLQTDIAGNLPAALAERDLYNQQATTYNNQLNPYFNAFTGYNTDAGVNLANPLSAYSLANPISAAPTAAQAATPEEYARQAALSQLAGNQLSYLNPAEASQAGTFQIPNAPTGPTSSEIRTDLIPYLTQAGQQAYAEKFGHPPTPTEVANNPDLLNYMLQQIYGTNENGMPGGPSSFNNLLNNLNAINPQLVTKSGTPINQRYGVI